MRIAYISYEYPIDNGRGGIGTYVQQIAAAVASKGFDVHVFAGSSTRNFTEYTSGYWVHLIKCDNVNDFRNEVVPVYEIYQGEAKFDLIESAEINRDAWGIKRRYPQVPLVIRLHAPNYLVENLKKRYTPFFVKLRFFLGGLRRLKWDLGYWGSYKKESDFEYQFAQLADGVTAPSEAMKSWAVKHWNFPEKKIKVIPNIFFPPPEFLQIPVLKEISHKRIVFFGRLNVLKGLVNATKAMKKILKEYPDWQFRVIGDDGGGPYPGTSMKRWIKKTLYPVIKRVEFLDGMNYEKIPASIKNSEIILLPSLFESFSYTCIEAMAAGKAVVGSKVGGMKDILQNNKSGLLIDPENYSEIYTALKKLIEDNKLRYLLSMNARERVLTKYDAAFAVDKFVNYYSQLIAEQK